MTISMIACVTSDMCIGLYGDLLISLKPDMKHFKEITDGHVVVMGRNTYESLKVKPLPGRTNIIISTTMDEMPPGFFVFKSVDNFLKFYKDYDGEVFIIGGAMIYDAFMPYADKIYLTHVHRHGSTLLSNTHANYNTLVKFPNSLFDYDWDIQKTPDTMCLDRTFGIVHYNFLTLTKKV